MEKPSLSGFNKPILDLIFNNLFDSVFITDNNYNIIYVNHAFEKLTGFREKEIIGNIPAIFRSGKKDPGIYQEFWRAILKGKTWEQSLEKKRKDNSAYFTKIKIIPSKDDIGEIRYFLGIEKEVTKEKNFEEQLHIYKHFPDIKTDPIIQADYNGKVKIIGKKTRDVFFDKKDEKDIRGIFGDEFDGIINSIKDTGGEKRIDKAIIKKGRYYLVTAVDIPSIDAVNFYFSDVTEIEKVKNELLRKTDELERFNKIAVNRELRMIELKNKIKELEEKLKKR